MTMAFQDIASSQEVSQAQVLIIARSVEFGAALQDLMVPDDTVAGTVRLGTLAYQANNHALDWEAYDFVVFEANPGDAEELEAARGLANRSLMGPQLIAMAATPVTPDQERAYLAAGVCDVLQSQAASAPVAAPLPQPKAQPAAPTHDDVELGQVTIVLRSRGGVGATTIATNLALILSERASVALIDLDIQNGTIATLLDLPDSAEFTKLVQTQTMPDAGFLDRALIKHASGVHILPAPDVFAPMTALTPAMVQALLLALRQRFDHVIIDMPQTVVDWFEPVLAQAARAIMATDTAVPSIKRTKRLIGVITEDHMTLPVTVVVSTEKRPLFLAAKHKEAARLLGRPLTHWIPPDAKAARTARDLGVPLAIGAKRSAATKAVRALGDALFQPKAKGQN